MRTMSSVVVWAGVTIISLIAPASAENAAMTRVLACEGDDAKMEVYLPQSVVTGRGVTNANLAKPVVGFYALDLSAAGKGKPLEPVRVSYTPDKKMVIVDQFTRGLPPTRIPVGGGTVDFDKRFGTNAKCGPFNDG